VAAGTEGTVHVAESAVYDAEPLVLWALVMLVPDGVDTVTVAGPDGEVAVFLRMIRDG
jgi:hypothetical protein